MAELERKAILRHTQSPEYRSCFVSDGVGGIGKDGHLILDLYNEYAAQPEVLTGKMTSKTDGEIDTTETSVTLVRESQVRLYMTSNAAARIGAWLTKFGNTGEKGPATKDGADGN